jgi:hypothetical protein
MPGLRLTRRTRSEVVTQINAILAEHKAQLENWMAARFGSGRNAESESMSGSAPDELEGRPAAGEPR